MISHKFSMNQPLSQMCALVYH